MNLLMNKKSYINPETSIETRFKIECHLCEESKPNTNTITTALLTDGMKQLLLLAANLQLQVRRLVSL